MKNKLSFLLISSLVAVSGAAIICGEYNYSQADAYSYVTKGNLPKTINLNDTPENTIRNYYADVDGYRGNDLLIHLKDVLKNNQVYYSYESNDAIWAMYEITDRDWELSPASEIESYDAETNTITNYTYSVNTDDISIHALYVNRDVTNPVKAGNHTDLAIGINQEHIWAKSHGFENAGQGGARGDPMHLWAGNARVNQTEHNNYFFGYVDKTKSYTTPNSGGNKEKYAHLSGNYMGISQTLGEVHTSGTGESIKVFEPQDSDKGDIARAIFYMAARYNYLSGSDSDGIDSNNPNLELVDNINTWTKTGYQSTTTKTGKMAILYDLLEWNHIDPPDEWEIHRNNLLFNNYTNNRNPFIDFPRWADMIWGFDTDVAHPASDSLNNFDTTGVVISKSSIDADNGEEITISAKSSNSSPITWSSNNPSITFSKDVSNSEEDITVSGSKGGQYVITATATIGEQELSDTCDIKVNALESIRTAPNSKTDIIYRVGEEFVQPDVYATETYKDEYLISKDSANLTFEGFDSSTTGVKQIHVSYVLRGITKEDTYSIVVLDEEETPDSLSVSGGTREFTVGDTFNHDGLTATLSFGNDISLDVTEAVTFSDVDMSTPGTKQVTVSFEFKSGVITTTYGIVVKSIPVASISVDLESAKTEYVVEDKFVKPTVIATYENGTTQDVSNSPNLTITGFDSSKVGTKTITLTYVEEGVTVTTSYDIKIKDAAKILSTTTILIVIGGIVGGVAILGILIFAVSKHGSKAAKKAIKKTSKKITKAVKKKKR